MADITKCGNPTDCPKAAMCYRAFAPDSMRQSYANFYKEGEKCKNYYDRMIYA